MYPPDFCDVQLYAISAKRTVTYGPVQNHTWVYDRYGNRRNQTPSSGGYTSSLSFNTSTNPTSLKWLIDARESFLKRKKDRQIETAPSANLKAGR